MTTATRERSKSLRSYPNLTAAARILGVSASTLSRRSDLDTEERGARDVVVAPGEVLRLGRLYRNRSINEVAAGLLAHARQHAADEVDQVEEQIEEHFAEHSPPAPHDPQAFLSMAEDLLPAALYAQVKRTVESGAGKVPADLVGAVPDQT